MYRNDMPQIYDGGSFWEWGKKIWLGRCILQTLIILIVCVLFFKVDVTHFYTCM